MFRDDKFLHLYHKKALVLSLLKGAYPHVAIKKKQNKKKRSITFSLEWV